jgi:hypothetical protein
MKLLCFLGAGRGLFEGELVMHICDNPNCCNPSHLRAGDTRANVADMVAKGRQSRGQLHGQFTQAVATRGKGRYNARFTDAACRAKAKR